MTLLGYLAVAVVVSIATQLVIDLLGVNDHAADQTDQDEQRTAPPPNDDD